MKQISYSAFTLTHLSQLSQVKFHLAKCLRFFGLRHSMTCFSLDGLSYECEWSIRSSCLAFLYDSLSEVIALCFLHSNGKFTT